MAEPLLWWHHHRITPPTRTPDTRYGVQRHHWGVTVWEGPTRRAPLVPTRVVDVVVTDPGAPVQLAVEVALDRMPGAGWDRRLARSLPGDVSPQSARMGVFLAVVLLLAGFAVPPVATLVLALVTAVGLVVGDLRSPDREARTARRAGHGAASTDFSGRIQLADALCRRATEHGMPHAPQVRLVVRTALWECRASDPRTSTRLNRWLADAERADDLATGVAMYARSMSGAARHDGLGESTVVARAAALAPELVAACASADAHVRREVLLELRDLRDACRDARAAREALEATVVRAIGPELRAVGPGHDPAAQLAAEQRRDRVGELVRELHAEAQILREVEGEFRGRDLPQSYGA